ncbi:MAG: copper resistance protein B [Gammaproteobacteria bacterium]|nr:copper resistance protein B [Gammaproteobacteria bacterium]NNM00884.1 copper resistance protein B [Gammaproteobacteria bacterium]
MTTRLLLAATLALSGAGVPAQQAADRYYEPAEMAAARHALRHHHGAQRFTFIQAERLEYQSGDGDPTLLWDMQGWWGSDINKLWIKTEGEHVTDIGRIEEAELQLLYSRAVSPFFDAQIGLRHDIEPDPNHSYLVLGLQGLAPYLFEIDAAMFLSDDGDVLARIEGEYELLITQRLILQGRAKLNLAAQNVSALDIGSGLSSAELGLRLRYEWVREFAPYIGFSWTRAVGRSADLLRAGGNETDLLSVVAGIRLWF